MIIVSESVIKTDDKYYPQTFLEECIYKQQKQQKQKQQTNYITEEIKSDSDSNDDETKPDLDNDE